MFTEHKWVPIALKKLSVWYQKSWISSKTLSFSNRVQNLHWRVCELLQILRWFIGIDSLLLFDANYLVIQAESLRVRVLFMTFHPKSPRQKFAELRWSSNQNDEDRLKKVISLACQDFVLKEWSWKFECERSNFKYSKASSYLKVGCIRSSYDWGKLSSF